VERERKLRLDQLQISLRQPDFISNQVLNRVLYGGSPYGSPTATPQGLQALTREELVRQQQTWWRPDNGTLILAGSLSPEEGFAWRSGCSATGRGRPRRSPRFPQTGPVRFPRHVWW
jgi:zinc protease